MQAVSTRVRLRVAPGSTRDGIVGRYDDGWKVRVAAPAEGGRANNAVVRLLAAKLDVPHEHVVLVSGHGARDKIVELAGLGPTQIERRLATAAEKERRA